MKVELLVTGDSQPCVKAIALWRSICEDQRLTLAVIEVASPEGKRLEQRLGLKALPAVLLDGRLVAVGVQSRDEALRLLGTAAGHNPR